MEGRLPTLSEVQEWIDQAKALSREPGKDKKENWLARLKRNWLEALILIGLLLAVLSVIRVVVPLVFPGEIRSQVVVTAEKGIPAYRIINKGDIDVEEMKIATGAFTDTARVVGHYALQRLEPGQPVTETQVSEVQAQGGQVVALPATQASTLGGVLGPGDTVTMVLAPRREAHQAVQPREFKNVLVLAVKALGSADTSDENTPSLLPVESVVVVAVLNQDMGGLKRLLGISDVYFVLRPG